MNTDLVAYYARRAEEYERVYHKPERQSDISYLTDYVSRAFQDQSIVEIACGTGYWTQHIARTARLVVATDVSPEVLAVARMKAYFPNKNVVFQLADLYKLPKPDQPFDAGFMRLHLVTYPSITTGRLFNLLSSSSHKGG